MKTIYKFPLYKLLNLIDKRIYNKYSFYFVCKPNNCLIPRKDKLLYTINKEKNILILIHYEFPKKYGLIIKLVIKDNWIINNHKYISYLNNKYLIKLEDNINESILSGISNNII